MNLRRVAIATCAGLPDLDEDGHLLRAALREQGIEATATVWDDPDVAWERFELIVIRSTWDYVPKREAFLAWLTRVAATTPVTNPPDVLRWNMDKRYLRSLQEAGVPVTPTFWPETPSDLPDLDDFVVKPTVSAGCLDTARFHRDQREEAQRLVGAIMASGRTAMVQAYIDSVDAYGETALLFFGGRYSHAIRKAGMLSHDQALETRLFRPEAITARTATAAEQAVGRRVLDASGFDPASLTYARVDLVLDESGEPMLLELELFEPSVFLGYDAAAPGAIARAIAAHPALC